MQVTGKEFQEVCWQQDLGDESYAGECSREHESEHSGGSCVSSLQHLSFVDQKNRKSIEGEFIEKSRRELTQLPFFVDSNSEEVIDLLLKYDKNTRMVFILHPTDDADRFTLVQAIHAFEQVQLIEYEVRVDLKPGCFIILNDKGDIIKDASSHKELVAYALENFGCAYERVFDFQSNTSCAAYIRHITNELTSLFCSTDKEWLNQFERSFHQLKGLFENGTTLLSIQEFYFLLKEESKKIKKSMQHAQHSCHLKKNRYGNNHPNDENRVIFDEERSYLNASYIVFPEQLYVAAQGPMQNTCEDFWHAICVSKAESLVTIVMPFEKEKEKCYAFWDQSIFPFKVESFEIRLVGEEELMKSNLDPKERIVRRTFLIVNEITSEEWTFTQNHYENWPDFGVSSDISLFSYLLNTLPQSEMPIWVNCSAGLGRTGTFIACHSEYIRIRGLQKTGVCQNSYILNLVKKILFMRLQRYDLVQSPEQLKFFIQVVLKLCEECLE